MPLSVGARAPSYRLRGLDNAYWILGEPDERRSVLVTFFGRDASASRVLLPFVERLYRCAHERATEVIGISIDSHRDTLEFATDYTFTFPILIDVPDLEAVRGWGIERHPALYLLDRSLTAVDCLEGWEREGFEGREAIPRGGGGFPEIGLGGARQPAGLRPLRADPGPSVGAGLAVSGKSSS